MKIPKGVKFLLSLLCCALFLHVFSLDETRLAVTRASKALTSRGFFSQPALGTCSEVISFQNSKEEQLLLRRMATTPARPGSEKCSLMVLSAKAPEEIWRGQWAFSVRILNGSSQTLAEDTVTITYPKPIAMLPLVLLVLAALFDLPLISPFLLCALYLFCLSGTSLVHSLRLASHAAERIALSDQTSIGMLLVLLWAIWHSKRIGTTTSTRFDYSRIASTFIGIWNPTVFGIMGRFNLGSRSRLPTLGAFFWWQGVLAALSLYLFMGAIFGMSESFLRTLYLPRYFTFLLVFAFIFVQWRERGNTFSLGMPAFRPLRALILIGGVECIVRFLKVEHMLPTIMRIGIILCISELPTVFRIPWKGWVKSFLRPCSVLLLSFFVVHLGEMTGAFDLAFVLLDPALHPNNQVLVTFLSSLFVGYLGGSFAFGYFTVGELLTIAPQSALIRAAVLDGCLLGALLSPFSAWNLLPLAISRQPFGAVLTARFKTLSFAMVGAIVIYAIDIIRTVAILRPLVFVFVVMLGVALELKRQGWQFYLPQELDPLKEPDAT